MSDSRQRDEQLEHMLRRQAPMVGDPGADCLDAETIAAWLEGGLSPRELELAQAHAASCSRCMASVRAVLSAEDAVATEPAATGADWLRDWRLWLFPVAATAAAAALWVQIGRPEYAAPAETQLSRAEAPPRETIGTTAPIATAPPQPAAPGEPSPAAPSPEAATPSATAARQAFAGNGATPPDARLESAGDRLDQPGAESKALPPATPAAAAKELASAAPAPSVARAAAAAAPANIQIATPDAAVRYRFGGSVIDRSPDGGVTWERLAVVDGAALIAGSAASESVCWIVGRDGLVLRSIDGRTFERIAFPEAVALASVTAVSAQMATVVDARGRSFTTTNGGESWLPR